MVKIIPALNVKSKDEFYEKINLLYPKVKHFHFDLAKEDFCSYSTWQDLDKIDFNFKISFDIHLMTYLLPIEVFRWDKSYIKRIFVHQDSSNLDAVIKVVKKIKKKIYIALRPDENVLDFKKYVNFIDGFLILGVDPGPSGQILKNSALENLNILKKEFKNVKFGFDGGVRKDNIKEILKFNPEFIVIGSSIFNEKDPLKAYLEFSNLSKI